MSRYRLTLYACQDPIVKHRKEMTNAFYYSNI